MMEELVRELRKIQEDLSNTTGYTTDLAYRWTLDKLLQNVEKVGKAWCGSWYGYQARVYYKDFETPPVGKHYDRRFGHEVDLFGEQRDTSSWVEYSYDQVMRALNEGVAGTDIVKIREETKRWIYEFKQKKEDVLNIIRVAEKSNRSYFEVLYDRIERVHILSPDEINASERPAELATKDPIAKQQGIQTPPHIHVQANVLWSIRAFEAIDELGNLVGDTIAQIERLHITEATSHMTGNTVFIGHGRASDWIELERYLEKELKLEPEEYDSVPTGGLSRKERLQQMLDRSSFAFLVLTAEDEIAGSESSDDREQTRKRARMNVVHEAGLFQGRLGFEHAIILLENGCEEFSNIAGLGQIRFDKGELRSTFLEIRRHLEERGIVPKLA